MSTAPQTDGEPAQRAVPYVCPFCGEEDLRPEPEGRWHCRSCLRLFSVAFFGLMQPPVQQPVQQPAQQPGASDTDTGK